MPDILRKILIIVGYNMYDDVSIIIIIIIITVMASNNMRNLKLQTQISRK